MSRPFKLIGGVLVLPVVLVAGLYAYRSFMLYEGRSPEGDKLLTAMPDAGGFEPSALPKGPILTNQSSGDLALSFGYKVGKIAYSYSLGLRFPDKGDAGTATMTARHGTRAASIEKAVVRRWDEPRKAYAVALQARFDVEPAVPALCIKAVIGPQTGRYDLSGGSLCIAQRDATGTCHPETLACGLIRERF